MGNQVPVVWDNAFDAQNQVDLDAAIENEARRTYLTQALEALLEQPIAVHSYCNAVCVVVFGRMAYINHDGLLSLALHDRGVLRDMEGIEPAVDDLAIRPTLVGIKQIAIYAIFEHAARALASRRGLPLDLRANAGQNWDIERPQDEALLEDAARAVNAISKARWRRILHELAAALLIDPELRDAARWVGLGQMDPIEAYHLLRIAEVRPHALESSDRIVVAHSLSATSMTAHPAPKLQASIDSFRAKLKETGVSALGWRLLLDSQLAYWKGLHANACYDLDLTASALIIGQKLSPPRLPPQALARTALFTFWEQEQPQQLRRVPPQIWRTLCTRYETRPRPVTEDVAEVVLWASMRGYEMDKSLRAACYETLIRHAYTHGLMVAAGSPLQPAKSARRYYENGGQAIELTSHHSVLQVAKIMRNCLETLWPQIEAGQLRVFFGLWEQQRSVIALEPDGPDGEWRVLEVEVRRAGRKVISADWFAQRVCNWCNSTIT